MRQNSRGNLTTDQRYNSVMRERAVRGKMFRGNSSNSMSDRELRNTGLNNFHATASPIPFALRDSDSTVFNDTNLNSSILHLSNAISYASLHTSLWTFTVQFIPSFLEKFMIPLFRF